MKDSNYAFITGKIRYLETKLLDATDLERMIDAPDLESAFKVFYDTDYAEYLSEVHPDEFEKAVFEDLKHNREFLMKMIPDKDFVKFLLLEYDFFNLKVIFKEKLFKKDLSHLLITLGFFEVADLRKLVLDGGETKIDKIIKEVIDEANLIFKEKADPYKIEFFFDKKYFLVFKNLAEKLKNQFVLDFVKFKIDLTNLRIFLRLKNLGHPADLLKEALIDGGTILAEDFINLYRQDLDLAIKNLKKFFPSTFNKYLSDYLDKKEFWLLEKRLFDEEIDYLRKAKSVAFGPEIVAAYFYAKKNANKNTRLIMSGKLNQIDSLILKERVRRLY